MGGCVFTQTGLDQAGRPLRDRNSASFVGAIGTADAFGTHMYDEAVRRRLYRARRVVTLSNGTEWAKNLAETQFPNAIIALRHPLQPLRDVLGVPLRQGRLENPIS